MIRMAIQTRIIGPSLFLVLLLSVGCKQQTDPNEMPSGHLDLRVESKEPNLSGLPVELPLGATVATMPEFSAGRVKWSFLHVDESHKTWLDQDAPVYGIGRGFPEGEDQEHSHYLFLRRGYLAGIPGGPYEVEIYEDTSLKWKPSPKPAGKRFIPVEIRTLKAIGK
jgi:hypothetical protein